MASHYLWKAHRSMRAVLQVSLTMLLVQRPIVQAKKTFFGGPGKRGEGERRGIEKKEKK